MILVTGASGRTGGELVRLLTARGKPVRALVRDAARGVPLEQLGAQVVVGDFLDPASLDRAVERARKVYLCTPPDQRKLELETNMIDAAARGGVEHVVKMSSIGASRDSPMALLRWHREIEEYLEASGMAYTHLRPHYFMQNTPRLAPLVQRDGRFSLPMGEGRISIVDTRDVAAVAAVALTKDGHVGETYVVTGPEPLSYGDIATKIGAATGSPVRYVAVSAEEGRRDMLEIGIPAWIADELVRLYTLFSDDTFSFVTDVVATVGRLKPRTYDDFAMEHVHVFRGDAEE
jgi:uncharacterized protein YbjT (DUF2867 family)